MKYRVYKIAINTKYGGYKKRLARMVYGFFDKKTRLRAKARINEELSKELFKPVIKNLKKKEILCLV